MSTASQPAAKQVIRLEHVSKSFGGNGSSKKVIDDLSLAINEGEAFALLGKSGTGKSVTLKLIIGLLEPDSGDIQLSGKKITGARHEELLECRKQVGFLFQDAALFDSLTLKENLAFPVRRHTDKKESEIEQIAKQRLTDVGLGNDLDKKPSDLSGGMRKRAGLARALVLDPKIVLVDEPSSGLDRITANEIYELLEKLKQQRKTLLIVTHDATGVRKFADRLAVIDQGKLLASGPSAEMDKSDNELVRTLASGKET
jgi:phospholipid/cholesterol/gamma-HCH transport system ATP-binding protein